LRCQQCGIKFEPKRISQKYCSDNCRRVEYQKNRIFEKVCSYCGKSFITHTKAAKYCSSTCASRYHGNQRRGDYYCEYCGKPRYSDHPNRNRFCSKECAIKSRLMKSWKVRKQKEYEVWLAHEKVCKHCGKPFHANMLSRIYCSPECTYEASKLQKRIQWAEQYMSRSFYCEECGSKFTTTCGNTRAVYCSDACMKRAYKRRRRVEIAAAYMEPVSLEYIYRRDKGVCGICGLPVPYDNSPASNWGMTVDHVIPISRGGLHAKSNCQLAHRLCNSMKQDVIEDFEIDWDAKLKEEPGRWNERLDELWKRMEIEEEFDVAI